MLSADDAIALLDEYGRGEPWTLHCTAVAEAAGAIDAALRNQRGVRRGHAWTLGLLHDIGRCVTHHPLGHGVEGYRLLMALGHPEEAHVCAAHLLFGLQASEAVTFGLPARPFVPQSAAERIATLADALIEGDRPTTLEERVASLRRRHESTTFFMERLDRAFQAASAYRAQLDSELGVPVEAIVAERLSTA